MPNMRYQDLCHQMHIAGWLSHVIAACNTIYSQGTGKKHFTAKSLMDTDTYRAFAASPQVPKFKVSDAIPATINYTDENGLHADSILVDSRAGLLLFHPESNKPLIGYLNDIPANRITYSSPSAHLPTHPPALPAPPTPIAPDIDDANLGRVATTIYRILRDTELARRVKMLHSFACQICGYSLILPDGTRYAEAHHIKPLGHPHNGPDWFDNIICVCPNHHASLDYRAQRIHLSTLRITPGHSLAVEYIDYHNELFVCDRNS